MIKFSIFKGSAVQRDMNRRGISGMPLKYGHRRGPRLESLRLGLSDLRPRLK